MKNVIILYRFLPQYRIEFYNGLKTELAKENVNLHLVYGKTNKVEALRNDEVEIEWANYVPNRSMRIGSLELLWQPVLSYLKNKDMIIVEGANKLLLNYILMYSRHFSKFKLGVWGHGRNLQIKKSSFKNKFKNIFLKKCDCYFAYTEGVKRFLLSENFSENKIVVVQNAIDTKPLKAQYAIVDESETEALKNGLNVTGTNIGVFCSGMYPEKRIDFILDVCYKVKKHVPDFHMIFIGSGIDAVKVESAAKQNDWIHYVGPKFGKERVPYFKIASIQLMPGLVGLGVLDSFVLEAPLFTTEFEFHSPEIEYLENGVNGVMTKNTFEDYSNTIIQTLQTRKYDDLIEGCRISSEKYTMEKMIENFKNGILEHLK